MSLQCSRTHCDAVPCRTGIEIGGKTGKEVCRWCLLSERDPAIDEYFHPTLSTPGAYARSTTPTRDACSRRSGAGEDHPTHALKAQGARQSLLVPARSSAGAVVGACLLLANALMHTRHPGRPRPARAAGSAWRGSRTGAGSRRTGRTCGGYAGECRGCVTGRVWVG